MEEIFLLFGSIFEKLSIEVDLEKDDFFNEQIYFEVYKIMFPFKESDLNQIMLSKLKSGEKIQAFIDILSNDILKIDLSHIKGLIFSFPFLKKNIYYLLRR